VGLLVCGTTRNGPHCGTIRVQRPMQSQFEGKLEVCGVDIANLGMLWHAGATRYGVGQSDRELQMLASLTSGWPLSWMTLGR
jgi:hypothetical protein